MTSSILQSSNSDLAMQRHLWKIQTGIGRFGDSKQLQSFLKLQKVAATLLDGKSSTENIYKNYFVSFFVKQKKKLSIN